MKEKIAKLFDQISNSKNILICGHVSPDGDSVGSSFGLALILRKLGKNAFVLKNDAYPKNLRFLYREDLYFNDDFEKIDLFIAVDSADKERIGDAHIYMDKAEDTAIIDHHITNKGYSNNDIIYLSSSTCEMVAEIFIAGGYEISNEAADYLYLGILTDTFRFQYDSADHNTLKTASKLLELGANKKFIQSELFDKLDINDLFLQVEVIDKATRIGSKIITAKITNDLLSKYNMRMEDTEGLVSVLRSIEGIEVSAIVKEENEHESKISLRSQDFVDVSKIATEFGGGGHKKAAGATTPGNVDQVFDKLNKRLEQLYENGDIVD